MPTPRRIQLKRTKGWRMPPDTVKVDRSTRWGNPFAIGHEDPFRPGHVVHDRHEAWSLYRAYAAAMPALAAAARADLRGKSLACWCPLPAPGEPDRCHAAVLLELANAEGEG